MELWRMKINNAIRALWTAYAQATDEKKYEQFTDQDMELWCRVTEHRAIQDRLEEARLRDAK